MDTAMLSRQRGFTFGGFIFGAFLLVFLAITAMKLIPAYMEAGEIQNILSSIAHDPNMQNAAPHDIQAAFDRQASIDQISAIKSGDIDISSDAGRLVLSASYPVKIHLGGNISLYIEFNPNSAGK
jgi:hypothetical protein